MNNTDKIPEGFPTIGGWDYERVWEEKQDFCQYVLKITNPTNFMKTFREFCRNKVKHDNLEGAKIGGTRSLTGSN
jgi:hypothetical protein